MRVETQQKILQVTIYRPTYKASSKKRAILETIDCVRDIQMGDKYPYNKSQPTPYIDGARQLPPLVGLGFDRFLIQVRSSSMTFMFVLEKSHPDVYNLNIFVYMLETSNINLNRNKNVKYAKAHLNVQERLKGITL